MPERQVLTLTDCTRYRMSIGRADEGGGRANVGVVRSRRGNGLFHDTDFAKAMHHEALHHFRHETFLDFGPNALNHLREATQPLAISAYRCWSLRIFAAMIDDIVLEGTASMTTSYTHILDLAKEAEPPANGILSRTIYEDDRIKAVIFGFGQRQELSEHTASKPAMLFFVKGEATLGVGDDVREAQAGTWVHMPASLKHSIMAKTPVVMLLLLLK
jgi:quercetin dioxygenase-like cupin family protein